MNEEDIQRILADMDRHKRELDAGYAAYRRVFAEMATDYSIQTRPSLHRVVMASLCIIRKRIRAQVSRSYMKGAKLANRIVKRSLHKLPRVSM